MSLTQKWIGGGFVCFNRAIIKDSKGRRWVIDTPKENPITREQISPISELFSNYDKKGIAKYFEIEKGGWWICCKDVDSPLFIDSDERRALEFGEIEFEFNEKGELK